MFRTWNLFCSIEGGIVAFIPTPLLGLLFPIPKKLPTLPDHCAVWDIKPTNNFLLMSVQIIVLPVASGCGRDCRCQIRDSVSQGVSALSALSTRHPWDTGTQPWVVQVSIFTRGWHPTLANRCPGHGHGQWYLLNLNLISSLFQHHGSFSKHRTRTKVLIN